jgi:hypothetical protein
MPSLHALPIALRALFTSFLLMIGIGYLMALSYMFMVDVEPHQRMGMGLVSGVAMKYHGNPGGTRLEAALRGPMADRLGFDDRDRVLRWVHEGAPASGYEAVKPIFEKNCVACHSPASGMPIPPLTNLDQIHNVTETDGGASLAELARVSHIHLFGISLIFLLTGAIFALSTVPVWLRVAMVVAPYVSIVADIGSWWFTKYDPAFGVVVVTGGALMGFSLAVQILVSLWEMWLPTPWSVTQAVDH